MTTYAKGLSNARAFDSRWVPGKKNTALDNRDFLLAEGLINVENRSDSYYPTITLLDAVLAGLDNSAALTGLTLTGVNFVGDAEFASGISDEDSATKELTWTRSVPGDEDITVTIVSSGVANATVTAAWNDTTLVLTVTRGTIATAAQVATAMGTDDEARLVVTVVASGAATNGVPTAGSTTLEGGKGVLLSLSIGADAVDGNAVGFGINSVNDTLITFEYDATGLTAGDIVLLMLRCDGVLCQPIPLVVAAGSISASEIAAGAVLPASLGLAVRNESGGSITAGKLVYVTGWDEATERWTIAKSDANAAGQAPTWVCRATIANNDNGTVYKNYRLTGFDTSSAAEGDAVYADKTTTGGIVLASPAAGDTRLQRVGSVAVVAVGGEVEIDLMAHNSAYLLGSQDLENGVISADANGRALIAAGAIPSTKLQTQMVLVDLTAGAEGAPVANAFDVVINVTDLEGVAVSRAQRLVCRAYGANMSLGGASGTNLRLSEVGVGAELSTTGQGALIVDTDANGDATVRLTDNSGVLAAAVWFEVTPVAATSAFPGHPRIITLTFA